jgi:hypothetical protein
VPSGSIERLPSGKFRAVVRAGRDPITKKYLKLTETCDTESQAILARERMLAQVEAESHPDRAATVAVLMARWMDVVDHVHTAVEAEDRMAERESEEAAHDALEAELDVAPEFDDGIDHPDLGDVAELAGQVSAGLPFKPWPVDED